MDDKSGAGAGTSNNEAGSKEDAGREDMGAGVEAGSKGKGMGVEAGMEGMGAGAEAGIAGGCVDTGKEGCGAGILRDRHGRGAGEKPEMTGCRDDTSVGSGACTSAAGASLVSTAGTWVEVDDSGEHEVVKVSVVTGAECLRDARAIGAGIRMECDETGS